MSVVATEAGSIALGDIAFLANTSRYGDLYGYAPVTGQIPAYFSFNDYKEQIQALTPVTQNNLLLKIDGYSNSEFASHNEALQAYHTLWSDIEENVAMLWGSVADGGIGFANYDANNLVVVMSAGIKENQNQTVSPIIVYTTQPYTITITNNGEHRHEITSNVEETGDYENGMFITRTWTLHQDTSSADPTEEYRVFMGNVQCCQSYIEEDPITHVDAYLNVVFNASPKNCVDDYDREYTNDMPTNDPVFDWKEYFPNRSLQRKFYALSNYVFNYTTNPTIDDTSIFGPYTDDWSEDPYGPESNSSGDGGYGNPQYWSKECPDDGLPGDSVVGTGLCDLYMCDKNELQDFTSFLYSGITQSVVDVIKRMIVNPIDAVISAHMVHTRPLTGSIQDIKFCGFSSGCTAYVAQQFKTIIYTLTFSDSMITRFHSFMDSKQHVRAKLFLPYSGWHEIDIDEFINGSGAGTMTVRYKIDFLSGNCYISVEANTPQHLGNNLKGVVYTFTGNIASPIPMSSIDYRSIFASALGIGASAASSNPIGVVSSALSAKLDINKSGNISMNCGFMGRQEPMIILYHDLPSIPDNMNEWKGYPSNVFTSLKGLKKFIKVQHGTLWSDNIPCTEEEMEEIKSLFEEGVYVREVH